MEGQVVFAFHVDALEAFLNDLIIKSVDIKHVGDETL